MQTPCIQLLGITQLLLASTLTAELCGTGKHERNDIFESVCVLDSKSHHILLGIFATLRSPIRSTSPSVSLPVRPISRFEQMLQSKRHAFYVQYTFPISRTVPELIKLKPRSSFASETLYLAVNSGLLLNGNDD